MNLEDGALEYLVIMHPGSLLSMVDKNGVSTGPQAHRIGSVPILMSIYENR